MTNEKTWQDLSDSLLEISYLAKDISVSGEIVKSYLKNMSAEEREAFDRVIESRVEIYKVLVAYEEVKEKFL